MSDDTALHRAIGEAAAAGRVAVAVSYPRANRNGAPGYRTTDIVVPWFCAAAVSVYLGAAYGPASGIALFVVLAGLILVVLRPYNRRRAEARYRTMSLAALEHWEALWRLGALSLRRGEDGQPIAAAPDDDWRAAARSLIGTSE